MFLTKDSDNGEKELQQPCPAYIVQLAVCIIAFVTL